MSDTRMREPATAARTSRRTAPARADDRSAFDFTGNRSDESIPELLQQLAHQGSHLAEQQVKLVEAEVRSGIADIKESAGAMAGAAVLGIAGIGVVLMAVSYLLGSIMPLWLGTLIVGVAALAGAYAMFAGAKKKLGSASLNVDGTKRTLERAPLAISGNTNEERRHDR